MKYKIDDIAKLSTRELRDMYAKMILTPEASLAVILTLMDRIESLEAQMRVVAPDFKPASES